MAATGTRWEQRIELPSPGGGHWITKPFYDRERLVRVVRKAKADYGVEVGRIIGAWGVKGGVKVKPFAADPQARLQWFYQRTPFYDDHHLLYPIARELAR